MSYYIQNMKKEKKCSEDSNYEKKEKANILELKMNYKDKQSFYQLSSIKDMEWYGKTALCDLII